MTFPAHHYTFSPRLEAEMYGRRRVRRALCVALALLGAVAVLATFFAGLAVWGAALRWWVG